MAYVSNNSDDGSPTVLIVESNAMSIQRLTSIFKIKDFNIEICQDGDKAVDEYIRLDPELVVISHDIPSLDGHLADVRDARTRRRSTDCICRPKAACDSRCRCTSSQPAQLLGCKNR